MTIRAALPFEAARPASYSRL